MKLDEGNNAKIPLVKSTNKMVVYVNTDIKDCYKIKEKGYGGKKTMKDIINKFLVRETTKNISSFGDGHINETYLVETDKNKKYILQKINNSIFKDIKGLMNNIYLITNFIKSSYPNERILEIIKTKDGKLFYEYNNKYWRMYNFIENSISYNLPKTEVDFYYSGVAFGRFQYLLKDFNALELNETIKDFHNTEKRYSDFIKAVEKDPLGRVKEVMDEINFIKDRHEMCSYFNKKILNNEIPIRVTHNDTKLNNVLFDKTTNKPACVIDLDTVMPGLSVFDFGDSIRFGASTALEDEEDLSKVSCSMELFEIYTKGFLDGCNKALTREEIINLPMGAIMMTFECGMRFLADYIEGDIYFKIAKEKHNLYRARTQLNLVKGMENKMKKMVDIVDNYTK